MVSRPINELISVSLGFLYLELPFIDRFAAAAKDGFRYVEIMWYHMTVICRQSPSCCSRTDCGCPVELRSFLCPL